MRKILVLFLIISILLSLSACGGTSDSDIEQEPDIQVTSTVQEANSDLRVLGSFVLEPSEGLDMSSEELSDMERYFFVVYDLGNSSVENKELSGYESSITITFNGVNTYESKFAFRGERLEAFYENCGYKSSTSYGTLFGGSATVRMMATFAVNVNDISEDCTAEINFELADNLNVTANISGSDIQTIDEFDGVFAVEDDPDAYQLARSMKVRSELCLSLIENMVSYYQDRDFDTATVALITASILVSPEASYGVSCAYTEEEGSFHGSYDLPIFDLETICSELPDIADSIRLLVNSVNTMLDNWTIDGTGLSSEELQTALNEMDVDLINASLNDVRDAASDIADYFESEQ